MYTVHEENDIDVTLPYIDNDSMCTSPVLQFNPDQVSDNDGSIHKQTTLRNLPSKKSMLKTRDSVLNLHGTGNVEDLANRWEQMKRDHEFLV